MAPSVPFPVSTRRALELTGSSAPMRRVRREVEAVAAIDSTVLVAGETGVGKGLVARALHRLSRRPGPFVHADCAALAASVLESELFGHERGAFTGAVTRRIGRFERAADGTLFLDEIGELDLRLQAKLLRVLQDREFEPVGSSEPCRLRARVIAATQRDLPEEVRSGRFRADLFYRLDVIRIEVPPLRARCEDVPGLAELCLARIAARTGLERPRLTAAGLDVLVAHAWPGNVRELENALERLAVRHAGDEVGAVEARAALAPSLARDTDRVDDARGDPSPSRIAHVLEETGGNVARAARRLGLARTTLRRRMARHGLTTPAPVRRESTPDGETQRDARETASGQAKRRGPSAPAEEADSGSARRGSTDEGDP